MVAVVEAHVPGIGVGEIIDDVRCLTGLQGTARCEPSPWDTAV
jgi:hypothetical protein